MRPLLTLVCCFSLFTVAWPAEAAPKRKPAAKKTTPPPAPPQGASTPAASEPDGDAPQVRGPTRIDFDDRLIQGQSNKSGSVYLYDRKELKIKSMVKKRDSFREEIVGSLYDDGV